MENHLERPQPVQNGTTAPTSRFALSLGGASRKHISSHQQHSAAKRSRISLLDDVAEDEGGEYREKISSFGISPSGNDPGIKDHAKKTRIIQAIPDKDWREESRRLKRQQRNVSNDESVCTRTGMGTKGSEHVGRETDAVNESLPKFGLNVVDRKDGGGDVTQMTDDESNRRGAIDQDATKNQLSKSTSTPQTADEEALAALLGQRPSGNKSIIAPAPPTEDEAFRDSYVSAPRDCTLEEYEATPVEGYGAAILRGYLKEGQSLDDHPRNGGVKALKKLELNPQRRPGLLGLGAKESGLGVELGAWGKGSGRPRAKDSGSAEATYNPLARRNKDTGEVIAEDELKRKLESQKFQSEDNDKYGYGLPNGDTKASRSEKSSGGDKTRFKDRESGRRRSRERIADNRHDRRHWRSERNTYESQEREMGRGRSNREDHHSGERQNGQSNRKHKSQNDEPYRRRRSRSRERPDHHLPSKNR